MDEQRRVPSQLVFANAAHCCLVEIDPGTGGVTILKYVVVHELCHLRVRDHSARFWTLVGSLYPEWRDQRDWLKLRGHALKAELARLIGG